MSPVKRLFIGVLFLISGLICAYAAWTILSDHPLSAAADQGEKKEAEENGSRQAPSINSADEAKLPPADAVEIPSGWKTAQGISVLCYHQIVTQQGWKERPTPFALTVEEFAAQMKWLSENGYASISPDEFHSTMSGRASLPSRLGGKKPILITFDDGVNDFVTQAEPIMNRYQFRGVLFIYPTYIMAKKKRALTWTQVRELAGRNQSIQSHTFWHPFLNEMNAAQQTEQFRRSKEILEKNGSVKVRYLAYPFGIHSNFSPDLLKKEGYQAAFTVFEAENLPGHDPFFYNRYMVLHGETMKNFAEKVRLQSLPIRDITPAPGSHISASSAFRARLPKGLSAAALRLRYGSDKPVVQYDPETGILKSTLGVPVNKVKVLIIEYRENNRNYRATVLYNRPLKSGSAKRT